MEKIAVFTRDGELVPFQECDQILFYEKEQSWVQKRMIAFIPPKADTINELREEMKRIEELVKDEKMIACAEISGIPFTTLDLAGHCIFTITDCTDETFDGIYQDVADSDEKAKRKEKMIQNARPVETDTPGIYELDLVTLQRECPEISSKKALKDFFRETPFLELYLTCAHIPPWLEQEDMLELKVSAANGTMKAIVTRKQCEI